MKLILSSIAFLTTLIILSSCSSDNSSQNNSTSQNTISPPDNTVYKFNLLSINDTYDQYSMAYYRDKRIFSYDNENRINAFTDTYKNSVIYSNNKIIIQHSYISGVNTDSTKIEVNLDNLKRIEYIKKTQNGYVNSQLKTISKDSILYKYNTEGYLIEVKSFNKYDYSDYFMHYPYKLNFYNKYTIIDNNVSKLEDIDGNIKTYTYDNTEHNYLTDYTYETPLYLASEYAPVLSEFMGTKSKNNLKEVNIKLSDKTKKGNYNGFTKITYNYEYDKNNNLIVIGMSGITESSYEGIREFKNAKTNFEFLKK